MYISIMNNLFARRLYSFYEEKQDVCTFLFHKIYTWLHDKTFFITYVYIRIFIRRIRKNVPCSEKRESVLKSREQPSNLRPSMRLIHSINHKFLARIIIKIKTEYSIIAAQGEKES